MRIAATRPASSRDRLTKVELGESHELENPCSISFAVERYRWSIDECTNFPVTLFRREFKLCENTFTRTLRYEVFVKSVVRRGIKVTERIHGNTSVLYLPSKTWETKDGKVYVCVNYCCRSFENCKRNCSNIPRVQGVCFTQDKRSRGECRRIGSYHIGRWHWIRPEQGSREFYSLTLIGS